MRKILCLLGLMALSLVSGEARAATCPALPFTLANGVTADASQVQANFTSLLNCFNNNILPPQNAVFPESPPFNAAGNGISDDSTALQGACAGASIAGVPMVLRQKYFLAQTLALACPVIFMPGAYIAPAAAQTVTLSSWIEAGLLEHLFQGQGTVALTGAPVVSPHWFLAYGDGTHNDTAPLQAAVNAAQLSKGAVGLGPYTYLLTPPLTVAGPAPATIIGQGRFATTLLATPGSTGNIINYGYTAPAAAQTQGGGIFSLSLKAQLPTAGYAISARHTANFIVRDVDLGTSAADAPWGGIEDDQSNSDVYENVWGYTRGTNSQAFLWWTDVAAQAAGGRSDSLSLHNVGINSGFYGNDGFVWKGMTNTLNAENLIFLQTKHGFWIDASQNTPSLFPQFASVYNLQVEGAQVAACEIDGGRSFFFTDGFCHSEYGETGPGGTQGNLDNGALVIKADAAASVTGTLSFKGMSFGISAEFAAVMQAQGVSMTDIKLRGSSLSTPNAFPSMQINGVMGQGSADYQLSNIKFCGVFGDTVQHNYGLIRQANVSSVTLTGGNFNYCQTGEVLDQSSTANLVVSGSTDRNGYALPDSKGTFVSNTVPTIAPGDCGTGPTITGNSVAFFVVAGTGVFTTCKVTLPLPLGLKTNQIQPNGAQGGYYLDGSSTTQVLVFKLQSGASVAGGGFNVNLTQAYSPN